MPREQQTTAITVATEHPNFNVVSKALEQRLPSIRSFLGGNEQAADRFRRVVLQSIVRNPDLLNATVESLTSAAAEAAQLGLEPSGAIGGAYIVRYGNKAQLLIDFRGLIELARRSDQIEDVFAAEVRERDHFLARRGLNPDLEHEPDYTAERSPNPDTDGNRVTHVYAVATFKSGHRRFEVMSRAEVDSIRARSWAANNGPWVTDWIQMSLKTVTRRLCKTLPLHAQAKEIIAADEEREYGGPRVVVEEPSRTGSLADRLARKRVDLGPQRDQPEQGEGVPPATPAPASQPGQGEEALEESRSEAGAMEGSNPSPSASSDRASQPAGVAGEGAPVAPAGEAEAARASASPSTASSPLQELRRAPSQETFLAFALDVLGREDASLSDLTADDLDEVVSAAVDSEDEWAVLYQALPSVTKAHLRAQRQHPRGRTERPTMPDRPNAEQLRAALGTEAES